ncbi:MULTISPECIES: ATP-binding protein [Streptomyces]|uniref:ATP-binding protein n=1 Tax=Streptomyces tsukubensis (strain DSM 42081 / NBRC 108919 / NRRL 18488 / 9993) TaxID=1114943 RepID=I2N336_STRT9|nr:ATP-binding protein [Streptomyces tsukubensis]MYS66683.1 ATP-binding protein [Streptomyces sp. SID5473]AZK95526.1 ATP-binding protein [Streptomyces tsukubensis]EIF91433.1 regulatory protein [Streptomyces tsukubensis NRRL18488]QKM68433.1 ATP-binding protein [Streptomyces tsukubensis NRRL18488]TAI43250.1 ATP-binding protein [Streptomyces tsukubensis]
MPTYRRPFAGLPQEVSRARRWTRTVLGPHPCADDALLVVTELGTNAIAHSGGGRGGFHLAVTYTETAATITVTDSGGSSSRPRITHPDDDALGGRGLALVSAYATEIRISGDHHGHTITAELCAKPTEAEAC